MNDYLICTTIINKALEANAAATARMAMLGLAHYSNPRFVLLQSQLDWLLWQSDMLLQLHVSRRQ
ncbi:hypothetical protein VI06_20950 [Aquitalea magnusonii]|nr:hypothetical protein VI06_20950 [Aquitalea magnusonii]